MGRAHDDDQHNEEHGDDRRGDRPGPVEAARGRQRDDIAVPGEDLLHKLALLQGGAGVEGVRHRDEGEAAGGDRRADDDPGAGREVLIGSGGDGGVAGVGGGVFDRQVGQQRGQLFPGAGGEGLGGSLLELLGGEPSDLKRLAQLGYRQVALGVRHPQVARREVSGVLVHESCSLRAKVGALHLTIMRFRG